MDDIKLKKITEAFTGGSRKAFNCLHARFEKAIKGYVLSHCFGQLKQKAEDIQQETWYIIWDKRAQFDTSRSFYSFVCYWANIMIKRHLCELNNNISLNDEETAPQIQADESDFTGSAISNEIETLFKITFTHGGPPHQLIAFGLNKLLSQWKPRNIVSELGNLPLQEVLEILIRDYIAASHLQESQVYALYWPLRSKMNLHVENVLEDSVSKQTYQDLLHKKVSETRLNDYYGQDPVHSISDWCYKVRNRVTRHYKKNSSRTRDKIHLKSVS